MERYEQYQTTHSTDSNEEHIVLPKILSDHTVSRKTGIRKVVATPTYQVYHAITEEGDCTILYQKNNGSWERVIDGPKIAIDLTESKLEEVIEKSSQTLGGN